ncbi:hypothetical protein OG21DRAFT_1520668 [Imleria badia]|nr:hypothetical protein OG21DRAFT_1520668 [Imleria badia]
MANARKPDWTHDALYTTTTYGLKNDLPIRIPRIWEIGSFSVMLAGLAAFENQHKVVGAGDRHESDLILGGYPIRLSINYALGSNKDLSEEVTMAIILVRNTLSFAIGYGSTPWFHMGYENTFLSAAFVGLAITLCFPGLVLVKWTHVSEEDGIEHISLGVASSIGVQIHRT